MSGGPLAYIGSIGTSIQINSSDATLFGAPHTVKIETQLDNGDIIGFHTFTITFTINCAVHVPTVTISNYSPTLTTLDLL